MQEKCKFKANVSKKTIKTCCTLCLFKNLRFRRKKVTVFKNHQKKVSLHNLEDNETFFGDNQTLYLEGKKSLRCTIAELHIPRMFL